MVQEIWENIQDYEGLYQVSNLGRVKSLDRYIKGRIGKQFRCGRILTNCTHVNGYKYISLNKNSNRQNFRIHRLVAETFISNPENKPEVNHKDEDINNNNVNNLEWLTSKENANFGTRNIRVKKQLQIKAVKLSLESKLIKVYDSLSEAALDIKVDMSSIIRVCKGKQKTSMGFKWMYYTDYLCG